MPLILPLLLLYGCSNNAIDSKLKYTVTDSSETDRSLQLEVTIPVRYTSAQLDTISSIIKDRNSLESQVKIFYLLPGQAVGVSFPYAIAFYPDTTQFIKQAYKQRDINGYQFEISINGLPANTVRKLYGFNPPNMATKTILGKFIHDLEQTATVIYTDSKERPGYAFIADFDETGKMLPLAATPIKDENGRKKFIVDTDGNYFTLEDSVLKRYEYNEVKPWDSLKSGY